MRSMKERLSAAEDAARLAPASHREEILRDLRDLKLAYDVARMSAESETENKEEARAMRREAEQMQVMLAS